MRICLFLTVFLFSCFVWGVFCFTVCVFECVSLNTYGGSSTCCLGVVVVAVLLFARVQESESFLPLFSDSSVCFSHPAMFTFVLIYLDFYFH